ncbi:hypothetical protein DFS34DRAFT_378333 [Phlyctochytrium arcticum]|nr:hypothetical protein DFS34DRAFT_378333 [Phlyctochytrium arcticum]
MITDPVAACVRHLSKDGRDFPNDNKSRSDVFFQIFNRGKARFLTLDHEGQTCFRRHGHLIPIRRLSLITNGYEAKLTFECSDRENCDSVSSLERFFLIVHFGFNGPSLGRIPLITELSEPRHPAHAEFRQVQDPDQSGGGLFAINRRPIAPAARVLGQPPCRPVIGIDFGQRFQVVAVSQNLASIAEAAEVNLRRPDAAEEEVREAHRQSRRQAITRVRGRHYREKSLTAWFERKHAYRVANTQGLPVLIDEVRGRKAELNGLGTRSTLAYLHTVYGNLDEMRLHFRGALYTRCSLTRGTARQSALTTLARYIIDPRFVNAQGVALAEQMQLTGMISAMRDRNTRRRLANLQPGNPQGRVNFEDPHRLMSLTDGEFSTPTRPVNRLRLGQRPWFCPNKEPGPGDGSPGGDGGNDEREREQRAGFGSDGSHGGANGHAPTSTHPAIDG